MSRGPKPVGIMAIGGYEAKKSQRRKERMNECKNERNKHEWLWGRDVKGSRMAKYTFISDERFVRR